MASAKTTASLLALADAANELADQVLVDELLAQVPQTPAAQYAVARWKAAAAAERGAFDTARAALEAALELVEEDPRRIREVADQFAEFGARQRAVALLQDLFDTHADHRVGARLGWLLERDQHADQAMAVWRRIWDETAAPAIRRRAADKLLELAAETGRLADLAIELEERLAADTITVRELDLLVELYTRLNDPISVSEILYLFAERSGDEQAGARRLAEAYIRMGALAQADRVVRELLADDPANAADYLQQLAVLAIERRRPREAQAWAEQLAAALGDPQAAAEITAGVFTLLELHDRAAEQYAQALAATPERVELWLLWADAMRSAGRGPEAVERLLILLHSAAADDLFLIAVDALLNIDADRRALRVALRQLQLRIARAPEQTYLSDAAADVLDSLGAREQINDLMEIAAVFAGPQRGPIVREMLDRARARGAVDALIDYGNILVMLNFAVPPQTFVDLGRTLLEKDRDTEAARAFSRAILLEPTTEVKQAVAAAYEEALRPRAAERIYRDLATTEQRNVAIAFRHGATLEQLGDFEAAFEQYADALSLLLDQLPQTIDGEAATGTTATTRSRRIRRVAANVGELEQYFNPVVDSLLGTARTPAHQEQLKTLVFARLEAELAEAASAEVSAVAQAPRIANLARIARFVGFCLNDLDFAGRCDRNVRATFPADPALRQSVAAAWLEWGLPEQALSWLEAGDPTTPLPTPLLRYQQLRDALQTPPDTALEPLPAAQAAALLLLNERDRARELLATLVAARETLTAAELLQLLPVSLALEDDAALERLILQLPLALAGERTASRQLAPLETGLRVAWGRLSDSGRRTLDQRITDLAGDPAQANVELAWLLLQLRAAVQPWDTTSRALAERVAARSAGAARRLSALLLLAPADEQAALLEAAWAAADANQRLDVLFGVAAYYANEPPPTLVAQVERLLALSPELRLPRHEPYLALTRPSWQHNTLQGALGRVIAAYLLAQQPDNLAVRAAAAQAFAQVEENARGAELADEVMRELHRAAQFDEDAWRMIQALVPVLSASNRHEIVQELELATRMGTASIVEQMTLFALHRHAGRQHAATAILQAAFAQQPSERTVRRELIDYLADNLDWQALVDALTPHRANAEVIQSWELSELADAHRHLGRLHAARDVIAQDTGALAAMRSLHLETALGQDERALLLFRRFLTTNRLERRFYVPTAPAETPLGGLRGYLAARHTDDYRDRKLLFVEVAGTPGFAEEYAAWWRSAAPNRNDLPELARSRIAAAQTRGELDALKAMVVARFEADQAHLRDFYLLSALAETQPLALSPAAIERVSLRLAVLELPEPLDRSLRARLLAKTNAEAAAAVWRLRLAEQLGTPRRGLWVGRWRRWLEQLATHGTPETGSAADGLWPHFLEAAAMPPTERLRDGMEAMLLRMFAAHTPPAVADDHRLRLEQRLSRANVSRFYPRTIQGLARQAAVRGDESAFDRWMAELVRLTPLAYGDLVPLDATAYLPRVEATQEPERVRKLAQRLLVRVDQAALHPSRKLQTLALLGAWADENGDDTLARNALAAGQASLGEEPTTAELWLLDLAARVGDQAATTTLRQRIEAAGLLPRGRLETAR
jgi:hypothetical protein